MKISTNSRYAIRFLINLANCHGNVTTLSVAQSEGISEKMLERIASKLKREGFVRSSKGVGGGYMLAKDPRDITVTMVLKAMETPYLPLHCVEDFSGCTRNQNCQLYCLWKRVDDAICSVTDNVTIYDIAQK